jgi:hypothetical protein
MEKEAYAIIYALKYHRHFLIGKRFFLQSDHKPLKFLKSKRYDLGKLGRWAMLLEEYDIDLRYIRGTENLGADYLSRCHMDSLDIEWVRKSEADDELRNLQDQDGFFVQDGLLLRKCQSGDATAGTVQLVVPSEKRQFVLQSLHDENSHPGCEKTLKAVQQRFWWPNMESYVKKYCKNCHKCAVFKDHPAPNRAPLVPIDTANLDVWETCGLDILGPLPVTESGSKYILVLQDYYSKWPEAVAVESTESAEVINWLSSDVLPRFGIMKVLITDNGVQFISKQFEAFCLELGIRHKLTSPFHPMANGLVEKMNRGILNSLRMHTTENQTDWDTFLPSFLYSYRTLVHSTTRVSPSEAFLNRRIRLPIDCFLPSVITGSDTEHRTDVFGKMKSIHETVRSSARKALEKRKRQYDRSCKRPVQEYKPNDRVYWRKPVNKVGLSPKLAQKFHGPFEILDQVSPVNYRITDGVSKINVHVNDLKKCENPDVPSKAIRRRGRPKKNS